MKIIYCHQYFNSPESSGGTRSYEFSKRLVKDGHQVIMITSYREETNHQSWFYKNIDGIDVYFLPNRYNNNFGFYKRIVSFLRFSFFSIFKILKFDFDLIIATSTPLTIGIPALVCSRLRRKKFIFEVRDLWPEIPIALGTIQNKVLISFLKKFEKMIYKSSYKIIALSPGMKKGIVKTGIDPLKIKTIPNSCDFDLFDSVYQNNQMINRYSILFENYKTVLYPGTLGTINGVKYLVDIVYHLKNEKIRFIIVGDGIDKNKIKDYIIRLGLIKNIIIIDKLTKNEVVYFFKKSDLIISLFINLKQMWNNSANKYFDSMAAKKPIIINYMGWQSNLIKKFKTGIVIPSNDGKKASEQILKIIYDQKKLDYMANNNYNLGKKYFDRNKLYKKFVQLL